LGAFLSKTAPENPPIPLNSLFPEKEEKEEKLSFVGHEALSLPRIRETSQLLPFFSRSKVRFSLASPTRNFSKTVIIEIVV